MEKLAIFGGKPVIENPDNIPKELFKWPILTQEDRDAIMHVVETNNFSNNDITLEFEKEFTQWIGSKYGFAVGNGTMSLFAAMYGAGLGAGDELICPSRTYWASCLAAQLLGASVVFADVLPDTMCIDPADIERCIGPRTKAIMVVHYYAHPAEMDEIMAIAKKHNLIVIEDVSHAQGGLYKGRRLGTIGHIGAMSMMSGKSFACGEMGFMVTDNVGFFERALAFSHYERNNEKFIHHTEYLKPYFGLPLSGLKGRVNQTCSAMGRVQLKYYDERIAEVRRAMNYFFDKMEGIPGIHGIRVDESTGSNMAGWYIPHALYKAEELCGLDVFTLQKAVAAETGFYTQPGGNLPLHNHNMFKTFDLMQLGKPTSLAYAQRDTRALDKDLKVAEALMPTSMPYFRKLMPEYIDLYVDAFRKVMDNVDQLLDLDVKQGKIGRWFGIENE